MRGKTRWRGWAGALALIVAVTGILYRQEKPLSLSTFDQPFYLGIAHDLLLTGRFTNGFMFDVHGPAELRGSGMRFSPLYPAMLATVATVDPVLRQGMACVVATSDQLNACPSAAPIMRMLQFIMLAGFFLMVWWIGGEVGGDPGMAWLTLALALCATPALLRYVDLLMTEVTTLLFATAAIAAWLRSQRPQTVSGQTPGAYEPVVTLRPTAFDAALVPASAVRDVLVPSSTARRPARLFPTAWAPLAWAGAAGGLLALTALTRPGFLYLLPFSMICAAVLALSRPRTLAWRCVLALSGGGILVLAPWILRNRLVMGRPALTYGYDSHTLVQRVAFDTMTWREYGLAYLCWLPDGTSLGRRFVGPHACDRFGWDDQPTSFYTLGLRHMLDETLRAAGGYEHHLGYLLHTYILAMPLWHIAVSIPLALRGAYVSHWWGLVLLPVCLWATVSALRRGGDRYLAVSLPALFMLGFNAAVAVNQTRYNLLLVPAYALAGAMALRAVGRITSRAVGERGLRAAARRWHGGTLDQGETART